jgi:hypothetical protein
MSWVAGRRLCTVGAVCLMLMACASSSSRSPFPTLGALSQAEKAQVIRSRTMGLKTLEAVLAMTFTGWKQHNTFDMIVNYDATGQMRFTALKDLGFNTRPIFDLLFAGAQYRLETHDEAGVHTHQGSVAQFAQNHAPFRAFLIVGEAFFLPGFDGRGNPPVFNNATASRFTTQLKSGTTARWSARPDTLQITRAHIEGGEDGQGSTAFLLRYSDYRQVEAYYLPGRVTLLDRRLGSTTQALLKQVEVNMPLAPGIFDLPVTPKEQSHTRTVRNALVHLKTS